MTSNIEFNDKDKLDIDYIGNLLSKNKFLISKKISTKVSFTIDKTIYLTQKKNEIAQIIFHKYKTGFFTKYYELEIKYALSKGFIYRNTEFGHSFKEARKDIWSLFSFYERQLSEINIYDYNVAKFEDISLKTRSSHPCRATSRYNAARSTLVFHSSSEIFSLIFFVKLSSLINI